MTCCQTCKRPFPPVFDLAAAQRGQTPYPSTIKTMDAGELREAGTLLLAHWNGSTRQNQAFERIVRRVLWLMPEMDRATVLATMREDAEAYSG